jgi:hypothetical protein
MKMPRHSRLLLISILALGGRWIVLGQPAVDATDAKVDGVFTRRMQSDGPGAVCAVMKNGRLIYAKGFGMAACAISSSGDKSEKTSTGSDLPPAYRFARRPDRI